MSKKGPGKKNIRGYDHIPEAMGTTYDYMDMEYIKDAEFVDWYVCTNLPQGSMWVAYAAWKEMERRCE